jgi:hypothetical protein
VDPFCCNSAWDSLCVNTANDLSDNWSGAHHVMTEGAPLASNSSACVSTVCAADPYCCTTSWDKLCVQEAGQQCFARYLTRTRFENNRVMTDACIAPHLPGVPSCPFQGKGPLGKECCRRSLVLKGVYTAFDVTSAKTGRKVRWDPSVVVSSVPINVTIVPDPVITYANGTTEHTEPHHLWQAAGPGGPLYPDCSGTGGPRPCNEPATFPDQMSDSQHPVWPGPHSVPYRALLVAALSSLITTNGHYEIDIRWGWAPDNSALPPDPDFNAAAIEGKWLLGGSMSGPYESSPYCYTSWARQRAEGLVDGVPICDANSLVATLVTRFKP